jgi:hypothetical protein
MKIHHWCLGALLILCHCNANAEGDREPGDSSADKPVSLTTLAEQADLVAVVQVRDTDYVYTRAFPSEGSAYLKILISYKANRPEQDLIEVYEKGLHAHECYFEDPAHPDDGRRYLVFLRIDPKDPETYLGLEQGCALEILVTANSSYALRYPAEGINLSDDLTNLASPMDFRDTHALISQESILPASRDQLLEKGLIEPQGEQFKLTHGVDLTAARRLINADALKVKPDWRR